MPSEKTVLHIGLVSVVLLAAFQDVRDREVSNLITVPLFILGLIGILVSNNPAIIFVAAAVVVAALIRGGYGAADAKILVGLAGLWPETLFPSLLTMVVFDLFWRKYRKDNSPLVVAIFIGLVIITFAASSPILK